MEDEDRAALVVLITNTMKYYRRPITPFILDVWLNGCAGFSMEEVNRAVMSHIADPERGGYPPLLSDVVRAIKGTPVDRAAAAWGKVYDAMGRIGAYCDVVFDDPVVHAVIEDMGGWAKLCRRETADLSYDIHRFTEHYRALTVRGFAGYPRVLRGDRDVADQFERRNLKEPAPVMVGDLQRCALVYQGGGDPRAEYTRLPPGTNPAELLRLGSGIAVKALEQHDGQ